jgi:glutamate 5-kinase
VVAGDTLGRTTTGGMITKIQAARTAAAFGVPTIIANGKSESALADIFDGRDVGQFLPSKKEPPGQSHWMIHSVGQRLVLTEEQ